MEDVRCELPEELAAFCSIYSARPVTRILSRTAKELFIVFGEEQAYRLCTLLIPMTYAFVVTYRNTSDTLFDAIKKHGTNGLPVIRIMQDVANVINYVTKARWQQNFIKFQVELQEQMREDFVNQPLDGLAKHIIHIFQPKWEQFSMSIINSMEKFLTHASAEVVWKLSEQRLR